MPAVASFLSYYSANVYNKVFNLTAVSTIRVIRDIQSNLFGGA